MLPVQRVIGHKDYAGPRKSDPVYDRGWRQQRVASFTPRTSAASKPTTAQPTPPEDDMPLNDADKQWIREQLAGLVWQARDDNSGDGDPLWLGNQVVRIGERVGGLALDKGHDELVATGGLAGIVLDALVPDIDGRLRTGDEHNEWITVRDALALILRLSNAAALNTAGLGAAISSSVRAALQAELGAGVQIPEAAVDAAVERALAGLRVEVQGSIVTDRSA